MRHGKAMAIKRQLVRNREEKKRWEIEITQKYSRWLCKFKPIGFRYKHPLGFMRRVW
jgi:hypothetical protein